MRDLAHTGSLVAAHAGHVTSRCLVYFIVCVALKPRLALSPMSPALGREALQAMKRADIQKLCKVFSSFPCNRSGSHPTYGSGLWREGKSQDRGTY